MSSSSGAQLIPAGSVLFGPYEVRVALLVFELYLRSTTRDGGGALLPQAQRMRSTLAAAVEAVPGVTDDGHADVRKVPVGEQLVPDDLITTKEAAEMLKLGQRQASRLTSEGRFGVVRHAGRAKLVSRAEVEAYRIDHEQVRS